jgi:hypothetical protein
MDVPSKSFDLATNRSYLQEMRKRWYESSSNSPFMLGENFTNSKETVEAFSIWFVFQKYVFTEKDKL